MFTGAPAKEAAGANQALIRFVSDRGRSDLTGAADTGAGYLTTGYGNAGNALAGGYGTATGAIGTGADQALGYLQGSQADALGYLKGSGADALGYLGQAKGQYDPLAALGTKYGGATTLGLNALGVGGQAGTDAARAAFQAGPGYDFNLGQGLEAINRRRAAGGMLDSGNADRDAQRFGAGLASNEYDKWLNSLLGFTQPELSATGGAAAGRAGADTASANLVANRGLAEANLVGNRGLAEAQIAGTRGQMLADLASRYGGAQAGLDTGLGTGLAGLYTNAAQGRVGLDASLVPGYTKQTTDAATAGLQGQANLWNLGQQSAKFAASGGLSGAGGGLSNLFGGGVDPIASSGGVRWI